MARLERAARIPHPRHASRAGVRRPRRARGGRLRHARRCARLRRRRPLVAQGPARRRHLRVPARRRRSPPRRWSTRASSSFATCARSRATAIPFSSRAASAFFAGVPLHSHAGHAIGTVCVLDRRPRDLTKTQEDALLAIGRQVMGQLELQRVSEAESAARNRFGALVEQLPGGIYIEDLGAASGWYFSPQVERVTSYAAAEWIADPDFFSRVLHEDDRDRVLDAFARSTRRTRRSRSIPPGRDGTAASSGSRTTRPSRSTTTASRSISSASWPT